MNREPLDRHSTEFASTISALQAGLEIDWVPDHLDGSAWLAHVPFAFWVIKAARPQVIVELGTHTGVSYFAFCQAVSRFGLPTRAYAVDTWQGDEHAGHYGEEIFQRVSRVNQERYQGFSSLLRSTFDEAVATFADGEIDLLHIDGLHTYEAVAHDFEAWLPKLSRRGIVLFHDTNVRERGFGVWRLWSEASAERRSFEFHHGFGLGVLAVGTEAQLPGLFDLDEGQTATTRTLFAARGDCVRNRFLIADLERALAQRHQEATHQIEEKVHRIGDLGDALAKAQEERQGLLGEIEGLRSVNREQLDNLEAVRRERDDARFTLQHAQANEAALRQSTSWRITRPLRAAAHVKRLGPGASLDRIKHQALVPNSFLNKVAVNSSRTARRIGLGSLVDRFRPGAHVRTMALSLPAPQISDAPQGVVWISGEPDTPGHRYRVHQWAEAARMAGATVSVFRLDQAATSIETIARSNVVVLWRAAWDSNVATVVDAARSAGATIVFDIDDLMIDPKLATTDLIDGIRSQALSGSIVQSHFSRIQKTILASHYCTATTEELATELRHFYRPTLVLPNGFDESVIATAGRAVRQRRAAPDDGLLRIGYAGGSKTHQRDFALCVPALARFMRDVAHSRLVLFRHVLTGEPITDVSEYPEFNGLEGQIEFRTQVPLEGLPAEIARFDINLAPLEVGNRFCESKSELKFFEAALCNVCTIASPTGPFRRAIRHGETGYLASGDEEWHAALTQLASDKSAREEMARAARNDVIWRFGTERRVEIIRSALEQYRHGRSAGRAFALELHRENRDRSDPKVPESRVVFSSEKPRISPVTVIIPLFNYEDFVVEALDSVAQQTLQDVDLIVIDDQSTDHSLERVVSWVEAHRDRFNRVLVLQNLQNSKLGPTRNVGFAAAESPFVLPLDADNRLRKDCLERCLATIRETGAAYVYPAIQQFGSAQNVISDVPYDPARFIFGNYVDAMALIARSVWHHVGGYENVPFGWEDYEFWCRVAEFGLSGSPAVAGAPLADYRVHGGSMLRTTTNRLENKLALIDYLEDRHPWLNIRRTELDPEAGTGPLAIASDPALPASGPTRTQRADS